MSNKVSSIKREIEKRKEVSCIAVSLEKLINSTQSLGVIIGQQIPIAISFKISKMVKAINSEIEQYTASHKILCERFANKDSEGNAIILDLNDKPVDKDQPGRYDIPENKLEEFKKENASLLSVEVNIPGNHVKVSQLGNISIEPAHLMTLDWLFTED